MSRSQSLATKQQWQTIARHAFGFLLAFYAAAIFVWQHRHLSKHHSTSNAAILSTSKEAFYRQQTSSISTFNSTKLSDNSIYDDGLLGNTVLSHRPVSDILNNPKLPLWVKNYATFHKEQRAKYLTAKRNNMPTPNIKFLISRCLSSDKCGGASDRLQDMPYNMMLANKTNRVLLVRWEKPSQLEHYLIPPEDGIDWTIQDEMYEYLKNEGNWNLRGKEEDGRLQIVSTIRRDSAAPMFRAYEVNELGHKM